MSSNIHLVAALRKLATKYAGQQSGVFEQSGAADLHTENAVPAILQPFADPADQLVDLEQKLIAARSAKRAGFRRLFDGLTKIHAQTALKPALKKSAGASVRGRKK